MKRRRGRPPLYSPERKAQIIESVLRGMEDHSRRLLDACAAAGVPKSTFQKWVVMDSDGPLAQAYRRALVVRALLMLDECQSIVDDSSRDWVTGPHGPVLDAARIRRDAARVNYRMWFAAKFLPGRLGGLAAQDEQQPITLKVAA